MTLRMIRLRDAMGNSFQTAYSPLDARSHPDVRLEAA